VKPPFFTWLPGYDRTWTRGDVVAGLTVWAVLVLEALAYATIAGVSPVVGLYAAPGALLLYAAFGSSRHLVTSDALILGVVALRANGRAPAADPAVRDGRDAEPEPTRGVRRYDRRRRALRDDRP
jgi:MFS superfamily sulfate permease-like transporter